MIVAPSGAANTIRVLNIGLGPTEAPTEAPTAPFVCPVCGEGNVVTNPDGVVDLGDLGSFLCGEGDNVTEAECLLLQPLAAEICGCEPESPDPTDAPVDPTDAPVDPTEAPLETTDAPTAPPSTESQSCLTISTSLPSVFHGLLACGISLVSCSHFRLCSPFSRNRLFPSRF